MNWRSFLARLPLPLLALVASYGVYEFQALFTPAWVALASAVAYESVYIGLSVARLDADQRRRAAWIARAAVVVSVLYNALAGLFALRPALLDAKALWLDAALAVLHGLPLAVVAYAVADLLLHSESSASEDPRLAELGQQLAALESERANVRSALADQETTAAASRDEAASLRAQLAGRDQEVAKLRESLAGAQSFVRQLREQPAPVPTRAAILSYLHRETARGRSRLDVARELDIADGTLRGWEKVSTNGHAVGV